ncbi:hypothetical protein [Streptomyces misionensis]|uniref:hypothetical protein n=1 Tax=Streptomyces misionensis TaxID=67331 RepID=UPI0033BBDA87
MTLVADHVPQRPRERDIKSDVPVVPEFQAGQEIAPIPPHTTPARGEKAVKAAVPDPERTGGAAKGVRRQLTEVVGHLPGRHS